MKIEFDLLQNAQDSIERAIELVAWGDEQPEPRKLKQAIQAVAHGVELLLKERLRRVHPCLIWENVDKYPSLTARTVSAEQAMARLSTIGGLDFARDDLELIQSLRATRNAIEHLAWTATKQEADSIVGKALEFALHFSKSKLDYDFIGYHTRKDDTLNALLSANEALAGSLAKRAFPPNRPECDQPQTCSFCRARSVDPVSNTCKLCGHWNADREDDISF